jgi:hypothetical protein
MPDDKETTAIPTSGRITQPDMAAHLDTIGGPDIFRGGYQTPQDQDDHWNPPEREDGK